MQPYNVLAPGPVNLHPDVQRALAQPMIHHRTPEFDRILSRVLTRLKKIFATEEACFIASSTGSGGMEALLVNVLSPGDRVLAIDSGKFGERWADMATTFGGVVTVLKVPWGSPVDVHKIEEALSAKKYQLVLCQACETSTGVAHPIREIGELVARHPDCLFLVDGITALGAFPLPMDEWKIDGLVGGSQKAFMLPTGLSLFSFSKKAWARIPQARCPRYYFDVRREKKANDRGETFFSSNVSLIRALDVVLDLMESEGLESHFATIARRAEFTRKFAPRLGFSLYSSTPANSLTALTVPEGMDGQKIRSRLEEKFRITVMGGQDQAKGKIIRIGHMGYILPEQMVELFLALRETLMDLGFEPSRQTDVSKWSEEMKGFWRNG